MLTSEFKEELADLGYKTTKMEAMGDCLLVVAKGGMKLPLVVMSNRAKNSFSTNEMSSISDSLFELLVEYASTPIEEREEVEEEESNTYLVTFEDITGEQVAITTDSSGNYITVLRGRWSETPVLTEEELDNLPDSYQESNGFVDVEQIS